MSILTKGERAYIQGNLDDGLKMRRGQGQDQALATICENYLQDTLDTIDALEKERDALESERREAWDVLARAGIPDEDEQLELPLAVERLWLAYEGANHNFSKYRKRVDALEAENKDLLHRAEAAEATQDAVAMMLESALLAFEEGDTILGATHAARALQRCPPVEEARERTRKAAEAFYQILHASGRCTCHGEGQCEWCSKGCEMCGTQRCTGCGCDSECLGCVESRRTIDALEAERDKIARDLDDQEDLTDRHITAMDADMKKILTIRDIAEANHDTRTIGGAHAALREILAVIEGVDVEGDQ